MEGRLCTGSRSIALTQFRHTIQSCCTAGEFAPDPSFQLTVSFVQRPRWRAIQTSHTLFHTWTVPMALLRPVVSWQGIAAHEKVHEKTGLVLGSILAMVNRNHLGSTLMFRRWRRWLSEPPDRATTALCCRAIPRIRSDGMAGLLVKGVARYRPKLLRPNATAP